MKSKPGDWLAFSADTTEAKAKELAAKVLGVPEEHIKILKTKGAVLARERKENLVNDNVNPVVSESQTVAFAP